MDRGARNAVGEIVGRPKASSDALDSSSEGYSNLQWRDMVNVTNVRLLMIWGSDLMKLSSIERKHQVSE
jgi:hypothetical protein